ncbi:MAG: NAD(P)-dependent oxidoreductase [Rhizobiales bacterium]|nr:NAD(P)-dependent oxidoreductase [Hyphomicrobiales bacterium]
MRIGFIGVGMMGEGVARNLMKGGHELWLHAHRNRAPLERLVSEGAHEARSLAELAGKSEIVMLCLTTSKVVGATVEALLPNLSAGQIVIDTGTSDPVETRKLAHRLSERGIAFVDAPMTGGPEQAARAAVGALIGADPETYKTVAPVISCYAARQRRFGPPGAGQTAKLISNYVITGMIALVAEAFGTARRAGIDWADLYDVMQAGSGNSGVLKKMMEAALAGDFDGYRWSLANAGKDIAYYAELAESLDRLTPLTEAVREVFAAAAAGGHGGRNVSHLLDPAVDDVS